MRQLNEQKYCGWCGSKVKYFQQWASECTGCKYKNYQNPKPCSNVIITNGDKILFLKRAKEPQKNKFDFPGGFADFEDLSMELAALREVKEEVGLDTSQLIDFQYLDSMKAPPYVWQDTEVQNVSFYYLAKVKPGSKISLDQENSDYIWVDKEDVSSINFAWDNDKKVISKYLYC